MIHVRLMLRELSVVPSKQTVPTAERLEEMNRRFQSIEGVPEQVKQVLEILKAVPPASQSALIPVVDQGRIGDEELVTRHISSTVNPGTHLTADGPGHTLQLTFNSYSTKRLVRPCLCSCHNARAFQTPKLLQQAIGRLFVGYVGQFSHFLECKECPCVKINDARVNLTYYFPSWFLVKALGVVYQNTQLAGPSLSLRTYRIVPDDSLVFHFAKLGMTPEIQLLFQDKLASPFDISSKTGRSALHVSFSHIYPIYPVYVSLSWGRALTVRLFPVCCRLGPGTDLSFSYPTRSRCAL